MRGGAGTIAWLRSPGSVAIPTSEPRGGTSHPRSLTQRPVRMLSGTCRESSSRGEGRIRRRGSVRRRKVGAVVRGRRESSTTTPPFTHRRAIVPRLPWPDRSVPLCSIGCRYRKRPPSGQSSAHAYAQSAAACFGPSSAGRRERDAPTAPGPVEGWRGTPKLRQRGSGSRFG